MNVFHRSIVFEQLDECFAQGAHFEGHFEQHAFGAELGEGNEVLLLLADEEANSTITRQLVSQLVAYATGEEIQFADRSVIESIIDNRKEQSHPLRAVIHDIVCSDLFRNK